MRVAFALDCCDREAMGYVAASGGITAADVRSLMVATVEHRFGPVNRLPNTIEWLTDNGGCYTAHDTCRFAREIGLIPRTMPSPHRTPASMPSSPLTTTRPEGASASLLQSKPSNRCTQM